LIKEAAPFVLKSMTAYGRGVSSFPHGIYQVEIQCVNRRFLDISVSLPRELARFETEVRKWATEKIGRGQVAVRVNWKREKNQQVIVVPNLGLAQGLRNGWEELSTAVGIPFDREGLVSLLTRRDDLFYHEEEPFEEESYLKALKEAVFLAIAEVSEQKKREGTELGKDVEKRMIGIGDVIGKIESKAPLAVKKYAEKLAQRLEEFAIEDKERWSKEVAIFADRVDISEEILRLKTHRDQFLILLRKPLKEENESRGKTLDFFLQELMREANTIGSKIQDAEIVQLAVLIKSELEKVREQLQNVE